MSKKNNYIALLEKNDVRHIFMFKSVSANNVSRTIKRNHPDTTIIKIYPEPLLFNNTDDYDSTSN